MAIDESLFVELNPSFTNENRYRLINYTILFYCSWGQSRKSFLLILALDLFSMWLLYERSR